jgi:tRNA threonylcarbamoyladenosine biosynthesis protein TsaE
MTERYAETITRSEEETEDLGGRLSRELRPSDVVYLSGDLGSGKTCLARGVARGLGAATRQVASPTFALLHEYADEAGAIVLRHLDLYRLEDSGRELEVLGLPESVLGVPTLVEWPSRSLRDVLPATWEVRIDVLPDGSRRIRVDPDGSRPAAGGPADLRTRR